MTKRILAIVMAMVMCLSVLAVEVFASNITAMNDVKATYSGTSITVSWGAVSGATKYDVEVLKSGTRVNSTTVTGTSTTLNVYNAGTFDINVYAKDANGKAVGTGSTTCTIPQQSTVNGITVSSTAGGAKVSWNAVPGVSSYYVGYTYYDAANKSQTTSTTTSGTSVDLSVAYDKLSSVSVRVGNSSGYLVGTWSKSYTPGTTTGNVTYSNGRLSWTGSYGSTYTVVATVNGSTVGSMNVGTYTTCDVSQIINRYPNSTIVFTVYAGNYTVGSYTYYPSQQSYGGVYIYGTVVSWQTIGTQNYTVTATANGRTLFTQNVGNTSSIDLAKYIYASDLRNYAIFVTVTGSNSGTIGSVTYYYGNTNYQTGSVYISGTYVNWQGIGSQSYTVTATVNGSTIFTRGVGNTTGINLANYISDYYLKNSTIVITVTGSATGYVGSATYYPSGSSITTPGTNLGNIKVEIQGAFAYITWDNVSGASLYKVIYSIGGSQYQYELAQRAIRLDYTRGLQATIQYKMGNSYYNIGSVSVSANGVVSGNSTIVNNPVVNGNTINGVNCTLTIGSTSSTLSWQIFNGAVRYDVIYTNSGTGVSYMLQNVTATTATIPLGSTNCKGFTCQVVPYGHNQILTNGPFATVTYSGGVINPGTTDKSEIKNLVLKESGSDTVVSWNPVSGASYYQIDYYRTDTGLNSLQNVTTKTEYTLPFSRRIGFQVYVYAYVGNRLQTVGTATHVAGDSYTVEDNKPADEPKLSAYVTNFKGVATAKSVVLSWNAVEGKPKYDVYWKRSTSSEWKKAKTTSSRALTVNGLNTNVSYDFKIIANGKESGIVTITTPKNGSTTVTAKDPAGAGTATATIPEILSAQSKNGKLEITWCKVKNATNYKVYINQPSVSATRYTAVPSSKTWPGVKIDINGTTATITGMKSGTYKIRIKASTDNGKTWTSLSDCDYRTVTVS